MWWLAIANCDGTEYELEADITFLQLKHGWNRQFSYDQQGIRKLTISKQTRSPADVHYFHYFVLRTRCFSLVGRFPTSCGPITTPGTLETTSLAHLQIIRLLTLSLLLEFFALLSWMIDYAIYSKNGVGAPALHVIGNSNFGTCNAA